MNTKFTDKQIMDLASQSSLKRSNSDTNFIDFSDRDGGSFSHDTSSDNLSKEIAPSFDFHPIGSSRSNPESFGLSNTRENNPEAPISAIESRSSPDSAQPKKEIYEKDKDVLSLSMVSEIDKVMMRHSTNLMRVLDGVNEKLMHLESRSNEITKSISALRGFLANNIGSVDGRVRQLDNNLREVQNMVVDLQKQHVPQTEPQISTLRAEVDQLQVAPTNTYNLEPNDVGPTIAAKLATQEPPALPHSYQLPPPTPNPPLPVQTTPPPIPNQFLPSHVLPAPPEQLHSYQQPPQLLPTTLAAPPHPPHQPPQQPPSTLAALPHPPHQPPQQPPSTLVAPPHPPHQPPQQPPSTLAAPLHPPHQPPHFAPSPPTKPQYHHEEQLYTSSPSYYPFSQPPPIGSPQPSFYSCPPYNYEPSPTRFSYGLGPQSRPDGHLSTYENKVQSSTGSGYSHVPSARVLPHALPTASSVDMGEGSVGPGGSVGVEDVMQKVVGMGFPRDQVRATVKNLSDSGQPADLNIVLDKLMNGDAQPSRTWLGR